LNSNEIKASNSLGENVEQKKNIEVFEEIIYSRKNVKSFKPDEIPEESIKKILTLTQRAPSSLNIQPFSCVLVKDSRQREELSKCMLGDKNRDRVKIAPMTAVFLADTDTVGRAVRVAQWLKANGNTNAAYLSQLPRMVGLLSGGGSFVHCLKQGIATGLSPIQNMPTINTAEGWVFKNTMPFVQTFILACTAHGLGTAVMEGFDERRIKNCLKVPGKYLVPVVVSCGYSNESLQSTNASPRLAVEEVFFVDEYKKVWNKNK